VAPPEHLLRSARRVRAAPGPGRGDAGLLFRSLATLDPGHTGFRLWRRLDARGWQDLLDLMATYRALHGAAARRASRSGLSRWPGPRRRSCDGRRSSKRALPRRGRPARAAGHDFGPREVQRCRAWDPGRSSRARWEATASACARPRLFWVAAGAIEARAGSAAVQEAPTQADAPLEMMRALFRRGLAEYNRRRRRAQGHARWRAAPPEPEGP